MTRKLTLTLLKQAAADFAETESLHSEPSLYGVTDGKKLGTYLEHKFVSYLAQYFKFDRGSSAKGIDLPAMGVDIKTTSISKPQSSCPFKSARQKIFGLGYSLLVFVYEKTDDQATQTSRLDILHVIFVDANRTADYQMTMGLNQILDNDGNEDDLLAFMNDRRLPVDDIEAAQIAQDLLARKPAIGYLTISNAWQWRLKYGRAIAKAGEVAGLHRVR